MGDEGRVPQPLACGQDLGWNPTPVTLSTDKGLLPSRYTPILADFHKPAVPLGSVPCTGVGFQPRKVQNLVEQRHEANNLREYHRRGVPTTQGITQLEQRNDPN